MEDNKRIGPQLTVIPEQKHYTCWGCKYYKYQMIRSGFNPLINHECKKMNLLGDVLEDNKVEYNVSAYVLDEGKTPNKCPYLKSSKRNDKLNDLGV